MEQEEPFIVLDITSSGQRTMASTLAADKYIVHSYGTTTDDTLTQAPYRWARSAQEPFALAAAQFVGRQLVGRKVEYAGDESMHSKPRTFGVVYADTIDIDQFVDTVERNKGKLAVPPMGYASSGSTTGDAETAAQFAPTMISAPEGLGRRPACPPDADVAMGAALTKQATKRRTATRSGSRPGSSTRPRVSWPAPPTTRTSGATRSGSPTSTRTTTPAACPARVVLGPERRTSSTPIEARLGRSRPGSTTPDRRSRSRTSRRACSPLRLRWRGVGVSVHGFQAGYGKTVGLPFPGLLQPRHRLRVLLVRPDHGGLRAQIFDTVAPGVIWYVNGARRYTIDDIPKQRARFFDEEGALFVFDEPPIPVSPPNPCTGCPSAGRAGHTEHRLSPFSRPHRRGVDHSVDGGAEEPSRVAPHDGVDVGVGNAGELLLVPLV